MVPLQMIKLQHILDNDSLFRIYFFHSVFILEFYFMHIEAYRLGYFEDYCAAFYCINKFLSFLPFYS